MEIVIFINFLKVSLSIVISRTNFFAPEEWAEGNI